MFYWQNQEILFSKKYDIKFHFLWSENFIITLYIILISKGVHSHPPPPPVKPPSRILQEVVAVIQRMNTLTLTGSMLKINLCYFWSNFLMTSESFLHSAELQFFVQENKNQILTEIHASFNNIDIVQSLIRKQQLLDFPAGRDFQGTISTLF